VEGSHVGRQPVLGEPAHDGLHLGRFREAVQEGPREVPGDADPAAQTVLEDSHGAGGHFAAGIVDDDGKGFRLGIALLEREGRLVIERLPAIAVPAGQRPVQGVPGESLDAIVGQGPIHVEPGQVGVAHPVQERQRLGVHVDAAGKELENLVFAEGRGVVLAQQRDRRPLGRVVDGQADLEQPRRLAQESAEGRPVPAGQIAGRRGVLVPGRVDSGQAFSPQVHGQEVEKGARPADAIHQGLELVQRLVIARKHV